MRVIQPNLNHSQATQDLLAQKVHPKKIDVIIVCEQYKNLYQSVWETDLQ